MKQDLILKKAYTCSLNLFPPQRLLVVVVPLIIAMIFPKKNLKKRQGRNMVYPGPIDPYFLAITLIPEPWWKHDVLKWADEKNINYSFSSSCKSIGALKINMSQPVEGGWTGYEELCRSRRVLSCGVMQLLHSKKGTWDAVDFPTGHCLAERTEYQFQFYLNGVLKWWCHKY